MPEGKKNTSGIGYLCMILGVLLIAAAIVLVLYNRNEDVQAGNAAEDVLPMIKQEIDGAEEGKTSEQEEDDVSGMPTALIDGYAYIGYLSIPALALELPVMAEWDYTRLQIAPCRYSGSIVTDDLVICGHNYDHHFGRLKNLQPGDRVTFTSMDGVCIDYEVQTVEILQPLQIREMIESPYDLSLYTCTYGGQSRVTVRCSRTQG